MSFDAVVPIDQITDGTPITYGVVQPGLEDPSGVLFVRGGDIFNGRINVDGLRTISQELSAQYKRTLLRGGELLISLVGNPGEVAIAPPSLAGSNIARQVGLIRVDEERFNPWFVLYYLMSPAGTAQLFSYSLGSVQSVINLKELRRVQIPAVSRQVQDSIVEALKAIDDKIDLNRRINHTLEAMAQAIFKSWFVDFDPVKAKIAAKAESRDPLRAAMTAISGKPDAELDTLPPDQFALLAATAALFPDEMEDSELGEVPKGWKVCPLPECLDINPARVLKKGAIVPYLDMANVPTHAARVDNVVPRAFGSGSKFINGDTLLARITPCLENGKTAYVDFLADGEVGWGSTEFIVLRPKNGLPLPFAYFLCRHPEFRAFAISQMAGTSGRQRVPNDCFGAYKVVKPSPLVADAFGLQTTQFMKQIKSLDEESKTLAGLRGTLLPKLLSGELVAPAPSNLTAAVEGE